MGRPRQSERRGNPVHRRRTVRRQQSRRRAASRPPTAPPIDLRNIRSPIVVFCSKGDNITPPQQALGWILDLYDDVDEIRSYGQTIVYTIHETHRPSRASSFRAAWRKKEHGEFSSNIDLIDALPPGLYEAVFEAKTADTANPDLVSRRLGDALRGADARRHPRARRQRCRRRTALRDRGPRVRDQPRALPHVRAALRARACQLRRWRNGCSSCIRCGCNTSCSPTPIPLMAPVAAMAEQVREQPQAGGRRQSVRRDAGERIASRSSPRSMPGATCARPSPSGRSWRSTVRRCCRPPSASIRPRRARCARPAKSPLHQRAAADADRRAQVANCRPAGCAKPSSAGLLYAGMARGAVDERGFEARAPHRAKSQRRHAALRNSRRWCASSSLMLLIDHRSGAGGHSGDAAARRRERGARHSS